MKQPRSFLLFSASAIAFAALLASGAASRPASDDARGGSVPFDFANIYWEYNASANDLGVHVSLDGEDWTRLTIENPDGRRLFQVRGKGPYDELGMTELFFEGAEPSLDEFPLEDLLAYFPEGEYEFSGRTAGGEEIESEDLFSHAIPDGPQVFADVGPNDFLRIRWNAVTAPPPGFPLRPIVIVAYQVIVEPSFDVIVPASARSLTVSPEFVASLGGGTHLFEVLAIEQSGNQTLTEGSFDL